MKKEQDATIDPGAQVLFYPSYTMKLANTSRKIGSGIGPIHSCLVGGQEL